MVEIGKYNYLRIVKFVDFGIYLDGEDLGELLLPASEVPEGIKKDELLKVFVYLDSEDRIITSTRTPMATVGSFAFLKVKEVNSFGAFLDWGMPKDLFVPYREQRKPLEPNNYYVVYLYLDENSGRIAASTKIDKFLKKSSSLLQENQEVNLLAYDYSDLGIKVIVNDTMSGLIFQDEVFRKISIGEKFKGYVKNIRTDGKIDITLQLPGYNEISKASQYIFELLGKNNGFLPANDHTDASVIYNMFNMSKKTFKKAIGNLYKKGIIQLESTGIRMKIK
ncbi:MAG: S1-like domain-containing RNA-binding protein [Bacteroidota bacterium]|nr:S1-like domain-containing RNA-binding protein [Bacteroidota bacterium]MDP4226112.1 S1-like domain-containing RNA-binding protein [Bacteroidota bacterium]MDP4273077.1 S1-like domain-containing RNA-binding protein [Bacteroidota bacterium]